MGAAAFSDMKFFYLIEIRALVCNEKFCMQQCFVAFDKRYAMVTLVIAFLNLNVNEWKTNAVVIP